MQKENISGKIKFWLILSKLLNFKIREEKKISVKDEIQDGL